MVNLSLKIKKAIELLQEIRAELEPKPVKVPPLKSYLCCPLNILRLNVEKFPMTWTEAIKLIESKGCPNSTARRHLAKLVESRYVERVNGLYSLVARGSEDQAQARPLPGISSTPYDPKALVETPVEWSLTKMPFYPEGLTPEQMERLAEKESHVMDAVKSLLTPAPSPVESQPVAEPKAEVPPAPRKRMPWDEEELK